MTDIAVPEHIDAQVLRRLAQREGPTATVAFPTVRAAVSPEQNATKLKNALRDVAEQLRQVGYTADEVDAQLERARALLGEHDFWMHQLDGLVLHIGQEDDEVWRTPFEVPERTVVQDAPLVTPLLPALAEEGQFAILAISRDHVRLLRATSTRAERVDLEANNVPTSTADLPGDDEPPEIQHRPGPRVRGGDPFLYHGHEDADHDRLLAERLFRVVDEGVSRLLPAGTSVVLAGVEENVSRYRKLTQLAGVLDDAVFGAPAHRTDQDLHAAARDVIAPQLRAPVETALARLTQQLGTGLATADLAEVVRAATVGRAEAVLVAHGAVAWGTVDMYGESVISPDGPEPGDEDLVDAAVRAGLRHGAQAHAVDASKLPDGASAAAILRF